MVHCKDFPEMPVYANSPSFPLLYKFVQFRLPIKCSITASCDVHFVISVLDLRVLFISYGINRAPLMGSDAEGLMAGDHIDA